MVAAGGRFLPEGKSFGKEGWVFLSTYLHMLLTYKGDRRPNWYRRRSGAMDNDRPYTPHHFARNNLSVFLSNFRFGKRNDLGG